MNALFITMGDERNAGSRMRAYWPAKYIAGAQVVPAGQRQPGWEAGDWQAVVFQKAFDVEAAKVLRARGVKVYWDACDPGWWWSPGACREIAANVDGVVTSCPDLTTDFADWSGGKVATYTLPDRLELAHFPLRRAHADVSPVRLIWYGAFQNRVALFGTLANLERLAANGHKIELTVCDDHPEQPWDVTRDFPMSYCRWTLEQENEILANHDIALLPPYPGPWGRVKSNNKALTAAACGLPVATGFEYRELERMMEAQYRRSVSVETLDCVEENYQALFSARDWEAIWNA